MGLVQLIVSGEQAFEAADELEQALGAEMVIARSMQAELPEVERRAVDPISLATLILSIPGAVLTAMDLTDRIAKRRRAKALIEAAARLHLEKKVEISVLTIEGTNSLAGFSADALLELAGGDGSA